MNEILAAIANRSSTRGYTDEKLTEEELNTLITAGLQAPTAANRQELFFSVLPGDHPALQAIEDEKNRLAGANPPTNFYYGAPTVIIITSDKNMRWGFHDSGIAVENIAIAAEALGLGSVILGCIDAAMKGEKGEELLRGIKAPEGYEYDIAIALGHKAVTKEQHTYDESKLVARL